VGAFYRPTAKLNFIAGNTVRIQKVKAYCGTDNIDNRIQSAYFMKRNIINLNPVNLRLRFCNPGKNGKGTFFCPVPYSRFFYEAADLPPGIMLMNTGLTLMSMIVRYMIMMFVIVMFVMFVISMAVIFMLLCMVIRSSGYIHCRVKAANAAPFIGKKFQLPSVYPKFPQFRTENFPVNSKVNQCSKRHVTGNTGIAVKMQGFQNKTPLVSL
jgi:hypothetical protein